MTDELSAYDYELPVELIARHPPPSREEARLMVVDRAAGTVRHAFVRDLPDLLAAGDCLALNDTRVVPARLLGCRAKTGGKWEGLFLDLTEGGSWRLLSQCRGKLEPGERIEIRPAHDRRSGERLMLELVAREDEGVWEARPIRDTDHWAALDHFGTVPLPPYMHRDLADPDDFERYQTVYARHRGSVAAPTAGLHFTSELLARCAERGVEQAFVTLHIGRGTFKPITADRLDAHRMHSEWCEVSAEAVERLDRARARGSRRIAVGTTTARALESAARIGTLAAWRGATDLFIRPPYQFRAIDGLLTNFHLPRSTLLVLVSTLAGTDLIRRAYEEAVREKYRFFSYGDAMWIV
ncbi:MAG: tRNA preQ1(34) S-adenosylmethionine ribosyltransferase-isomerase QueA [Deltaproteobacteria bacterium]